MIIKWSSDDHRMIIVWSSNDNRMIIERPYDHHRIVIGGSLNYHWIIVGWSFSGPRMLSELSSNADRMITEWAPIYSSCHQTASSLQNIPSRKFCHICHYVLCTEQTFALQVPRRNNGRLRPLFIHPIYWDRINLNQFDTRQQITEQFTQPCVNFSILRLPNTINSA